MGPTQNGPGRLLVLTSLVEEIYLPMLARLSHGGEKVAWRKQKRALSRNEAGTLALSAKRKYEPKSSIRILAGKSQKTAYAKLADFRIAIAVV